MTKEIKIGLIGLGEIGRIAHIPALTEKLLGRGLNLVVIADKATRQQPVGISFYKRLSGIIR